MSDAGSDRGHADAHPQRTAGPQARMSVEMPASNAIKVAICEGPPLEEGYIGAHEYRRGAFDQQTLTLD